MVDIRISFMFSVSIDEICIDCSTSFFWNDGWSCVHRFRWVPFMGVGWNREGGNRVKYILSSKLKRFRFRDIGSQNSYEYEYIIFG